MPSVRERLTGGGAPRPPVEAPARVSFDDIVERLEASGRDFDAGLLARVHEFSAEKHVDQKRRSGEPYVTHPMQVAFALADLGFDATCVAAGLLHDVLEDTLATRDELEERFGPDIAELVEGVTKIGRHEYVRRDQAQAETFRKLILASVKDVRAILVKLADRWHNMTTLEHLPSESRRRIARETLEIYAPIARRLGMSRVQGDLEDLAFFHLYPHQYTDLAAGLEEKKKTGRKVVEEVRERLVERLQEAGVEAEISYRVKRFYSIYTKMRQRGLELSQLYDYVAFRILTAEVKDCYAALGVVHQTWRPVPGRIKDYIAMPKPNLYQSLHTTLVGRDGHPFEVQIRTREMDRIAEQGIAAHWSYKEGLHRPDDPEANVVWLRQLVEWQKEVEDPRAFMTALKVDLYPDEVYVFTPKGDVFAFPYGATPLDFAYRVHTELGHRCSGARVNGKLVPLRTRLENGDIVEILTAQNRQPSRDWLKFVGTSRAKSKIRHWLNTEQKKRSMEIGRRSLEKELKKHRVAYKRFVDEPRLAELLVRDGYGNVEDLLSAIGFGKITVRQVLARVLSEEQLETREEKPGLLRQAVERILPFGSDAVTVKGHGDLLAYLAKCCSPVPGEEVVGYITRGRGVSVHSVDCPNVQNLLYNPEREIEVEWAGEKGEVFPVVLRIETEDRPGVLARLTEIIAKHGSNITQMETDTREARETGRATIEVAVEIRDRRHLERIRRAVADSPGVLAVDRPMRG